MAGGNLVQLHSIGIYWRKKSPARLGYFLQHASSVSRYFLIFNEKFDDINIF